MEFKINATKTVRYVAQGFTTGLTDLKLKVRKPDGSLFDFGGAVTELVLTEISNGEYEGTYTPDTLGTWQELVSSATNQDKAVRSYTVVNVVVADVKTTVDSIETKVDNVDTKITSVDGKVDTVDTKITAVDGKVDGIDTKTTAIDGKADNIKTDTAAIKAKTDNLPADVNADLTIIKDKIDNIDLQVGTGGHFSN